MWSGRETLALLQCHAKHRIELKTRKRKVIGYEEILQDLERMHILVIETKSQVQNGRNEKTSVHNPLIY